MNSLRHAILAFAVGFSSIAGASSIVFTTAGDWNEPSNWDLGVLPVAGDDVYIDANVSLTNSTPVFNSYTLNDGKTHTFNGWDTLLSATTVTLNGTMTHAQNTAANTNSLGVWVPNARVNIACADMTMNVGSKIDVTSKGYLGGTTTYTKGKGPGGGGATNVSGGGGHGGIGGAYGDTYTMKGKPYGNPAYPTEPGSGGGMGQQSSTPCHGGGAVKIAATGTVTVNGEILARSPSMAKYWHQPLPPLLTTQAADRAAQSSSPAARSAAPAAS